MQLARAHGFETYTIVISLADVLIDDFADLAAARAELLACADEFENCGDEWYQQRARDLLAKCTESKHTDTE